jgi:NAD(P)-dependent dehydrogenase (short-subunit alcohol dehydrogenase family)
MALADFSMNWFSLKGKTALVTGGNTGLGRAFSVAYATAGANVYSVSLDAAGDSVTKQLLEPLHGNYASCTLDLTSEQHCAKAIELCLDNFNQLDIVHNNAGICINKEFPGFDRPSWDKMVAINLTAAYELSNEAGKFFKDQQSGKLIYTASLYSKLGGQWSPAYSATKHGIAGLAKAYCDELAQYNVQSNAIAPGYFQTELTQQTKADTQRNQFIEQHTPAGHWGKPEDLMGTAIFLASKASDFINGAVLPVDGGYLTR